MPQKHYWRTRANPRDTKLKKIPKNKIKKETEIINQVIGYVIDNANIRGTSDLVYAGAQLVLERL